MSFARPLVYVLLVLNLVLLLLLGMDLAGLPAPWHVAGESGRLARQLAAERIVLVPDAAPAELPTPPAPARLAESAAASSSAASAAVAASAPLASDEPSCIAFHNLGADDVDSLRKLVEPVSEHVKLANSGVVPASYWVNLPPSGGREGASRRGEQLARAGVTDYIIVREAGPTQFAISLGLFRSEEAARRLVEQLQKKNVSGMRVTVRDNTGRGARSELRGPASVLATLQSTVRERIKHAEDDSCHG